MSAKEKEVWSDVTGRSVMAANLILKTNPGMFNMLVQNPEPNTDGDVDFGAEILAIAGEINA